MIRHPPRPTLDRSSAASDVDKRQRIYFPPRWRYDFLRALDYFQWINAPADERMTDAIELLLSKRTADGRWKQGQNWAGRVFFEMDAVGQPGRWNTLRALRVLRWWPRASGG